MKEQIQYVRVNLLRRREGWNPRFDFGDLSELKESIRIHGIQRPLILRNAEEGLEVLDGDRRFTVVEQLEAEGHLLETVPAFVRSSSISDFDAMVEMMTANSGKPFLPLEEAMAFRKMKESGRTSAEIAKQLGRSVLFVEGRLILLEAPAVVQNAVKSGEVGSTMASDIAYKHRDNPAEQERLVRKARQGRKGKAEVRAELAGKDQTQIKMQALADEIDSPALRRYLELLPLEAELAVSSVLARASLALRGKI